MAADDHIFVQVDQFCYLGLVAKTIEHFVSAPLAMDNLYQIGGRTWRETREPLSRIRAKSTAAVTKALVVLGMYVSSHR
jgi:hypothetical protein